MDFNIKMYVDKIKFLEVRAKQKNMTSSELANTLLVSQELRELLTCHDTYLFQCSRSVQINEWDAGASF